MIFTWSFLAFYDIPGPGKYSFSRSAYRQQVPVQRVKTFSEEI